MCHCSGGQRTQILKVHVTSKQTNKTRQKTTALKHLHPKSPLCQGSECTAGPSLPRWAPPGSHTCLGSIWAPVWAPRPFLKWPECVPASQVEFGSVSQLVPSRLHLHFLFPLARQTLDVACLSTCCGAVAGPSHPCGVVPGLVKGCGP